MLVMVSPAKRLAMDVDDAAASVVRATAPYFQKDACYLMGLLRDYRVAQLKALMGISDALAKLNHARNQAFSAKPSPGQTCPAIRAFQGDVYKHLDFASLSEQEKRYLSGHAVILSGLYGLLRPFDAMQAYRLEMGSALPNQAGKDLVHYWGTRVTQRINRIIKDEGHKLVLNLASKEYAAVVQKDQLAVPCLDIQFKVRRDGVLRTLGMDAKRARGAMWRYAVQNAKDDPEALKAFVWQSYTFHPASSTDDAWVWLKEHV
jgi:uncharacterized protein